MLTLRPYQINFVDELREALRTAQRVCAVAPCGAGKRLILVYLATAIAAKGKRLLIATNRRILVQQMADECKQRGVTFGVIMASEAENRDAQVQVASLQTLQARHWRNLPPADIIFIDEAHNMPRAYLDMMKHYQDAKVVGVTATPVGPSGRTLIGLVDRVIEPVKNTQLIQDGWLLKTRCIAPSEPDVRGVWIDSEGKKHEGVDINNSGEFSQKQLAQVVESCTVFSDMFQWWQPYSDMQTICIAPRVKYAYGLCEQFRERGFPAEVIEAGTSQKDRDKIFSDFKQRLVRVVVGVDVPKEGLDLPIAQCGIDLQPCHQFRNYWQKVGRVRRPHPGQTEAIWLDFAGNLWRHGIHPDEDPPWDEVVDDKTMLDLLAERAGRKCRKCGSTDILHGRCQDCGADCSEAKKPWMCSNCAYMLSPWERLIDGKCPNCMHPVTKPIRRIRMANGQMRVVASDEVKRRKKSKHTDAQKCWIACLMMAYHRHKPLNFARWLYEKQMHRYPDPKELHSCPDHMHSADWARDPGAVYGWIGRKHRKPKH